ncbi:MAG: hypothetical protein LUH54_05825, partial [Firmicutes bacterium]|nr:hypothetical protein [Bacillota bacterium]
MTNDKDERDFWNLSAYVPKRDASERANMARRESAAKDTSSVEIELSDSGDDKWSDAPRHATALSYSRLAQRFREVDLTQTPPMPQVPPIPPVPPVPPVSPVPSVTQVPPVPPVAPATQVPQVQNPRSVPASTSRPASKPVSIPRVQTAKKKESSPIYGIDIKNDYFIEEYVPKDCYIMKVAIYGCTEYDFYAGFRRDAKKYFKATVKKAENVPFVSYTPQY